MNIKNIIQVLETEIGWCLDNPADNLSKQFQKGFGAGLKQAIFLIKRLERNGKKNKKHNKYEPKITITDDKGKKHKVGEVFESKTMELEVK